MKVLKLYVQIQHASKRHDTDETYRRGKASSLRKGILRIGVASVIDTLKKC